MHLTFKLVITKIIFVIFLAFLGQRNFQSAGHVERAERRLGGAGTENLGFHAGQPADELTAGKSPSAWGMSGTVINVWL